MRHAWLLVTVFAVLLSIAVPALANDCTTYVDPVTGAYTVFCFGGGGSGCGEGCEPPPPPTCEPGSTATTVQVVPNPSDPDVCFYLTVEYDTCTGEIVTSSTDYDTPVDCGSPDVTDNPCDEFTWNGGNPTCTRYCDGFPEWQASTSLALPEMFLDVRPFPATLVRWDTVMRADRTPMAVSTGTLNYAPLGGGTPSAPEVGDWKDIILTLRFVPAYSGLAVTLPHIGQVTLPAGQLYTFRWEKPSHPAAGGSVLAGSVPGFDELPADMPVYQGYGGSAYRLFYEFRYKKYTRKCRPGPDDDGNYNCGKDPVTGNFTKHYEYEWVSHSETQEIPPYLVSDLPAGIAVDLNGDGTPDAYWDSNLTIRRMDDANSVSNPTWARSWNWGGAIYWGVREGQGEIGWPGTP